MSATSHHTDPGDGRPPVTELLSAFNATVAVPEPQWASARDLTLVLLALAAQGAQDAASQAVADEFRAAGGDRDILVRVPGTDVRLPAVWAASLTATAMQSARLRLSSSTEPEATGDHLMLAVVVAAAVVLAEHDQRSFGECIDGVAVAIEIVTRLVDGLAPGHLDRGWHAPGTFGVLGAASAAARIGGADPTLTASTFGIAGTQAAGIGGAAGGPLAAIIAGRAAANAVESFLLARAGFSGPLRIIEGRRGFGEVVGAGGDYRRIVEGLGTEWRAGRDVTGRPIEMLGDAGEDPGSLLRSLGTQLSRFAALDRTAAASEDAREVVAAARAETRDG